MTVDTIQLELSPSPIESAGRVNSIRLIADAGGAALASVRDSVEGTSALSLSHIDGVRIDRAQPLFGLKSPFGAPFWDVASTPNGVAGVWTRPGSASSPLVLRRGSAGEEVLTSQYPMGVFQNPRFVRGEQGTAITAITQEGGESRVALFRNGQHAYVSLPAAGPGLLLDGLLLRQPGGYLLFFLVLPQGPRAAERTDLRRETLQPGVLTCAPLGPDLQPAGERTRPFGDVPLFEFDADVTGNRVFVVATPRRGYLATRGTVTGAAVQWTPSLAALASEELVSPSVLALGTSAVAAAIDASTAERPVIRVGLYREER
jgi:hypothetical protein